MMPPDFLNASARIEWHRITTALDREGRLSKLDVAVIAAYCEAYEEFSRISVMIDETGPVVQTAKGNWVQHPLLSVKNNASKRMLTYAKQICLTPMSRGKIGVVEQDDDFEVFINKG